MNSNRSSFYCGRKERLMQRINIADGVTLNIIPSEKFKTNFLNVSFVVPLERENVTNAALLSRVLCRATSKNPSMSDISKKLEYLYDMSLSMRSFKRGEKLILAYDSDFLKNEYIPDGEDMTKSAVCMFEEIMFDVLVSDNAFDERVVSGEKVDLINTINSLINNKNAYAKEKCTSLMCEGEKYSISEIGYVEDAEKITPSSLYKFYLEFLKTATVEIFFTGECDQKALSEKFKAVFARTERKAVELPETVVKSDARAEVNNVTEEMPVNQGKLAMGFRTGVTVKDKDCTAFALFCEVFGGSPMSKLFMNVREKLSLCYYCKAMGDSFKGVMFVLSGIESENRDKSVNAILKELSDIQNGNVTSDEFEAARLSLINAYKELYDNPTALSAWYLSRILSGVLTEPDKVIEDIQSTTLSQVVEVSKKVKPDTIYFLKGTQDGQEADE